MLTAVVLESAGASASVAMVSSAPLRCLHGYGGFGSSAVEMDHQVKLHGPSSGLCEGHHQTGDTLTQETRVGVGSLQAQHQGWVA